MYVHGFFEDFCETLVLVQYLRGQNFTLHHSVGADCHGCQSAPFLQVGDTEKIKEARALTTTAVKRKDIGSGWQ